MKATNWYKKLILSAVMSGSFLVFGGIYQSIKVTDTSYMNDDEIKFVKRFDESQERVLASTKRELKAIQYLPVNEYNNALIGGKWEITRIEDENEAELYNRNDESRKILVDFSLVGTSQIMINGDESYTFDLSFMHESGMTIALFRSFGKGYEIIEARRYKEAKYSTVTTNLSSDDSPVKLEKNLNIREISSGPMRLERAMIPTLGNTPIVLGANVDSDQEVNGYLTVANNAIQGLSFTVANRSGKSVSYDLGDIELAEAGSFSVEIGNELASGIVTNNGKSSYRIRFASGPLKGALLNFSTEGEIERISEEREEVERMKEEAALENDMSATNIDQSDASVSRKVEQSNVVDASFKQPVQEEVNEDELTDQEWEELYGEEPIENDNFENEVERQGFGF